MSELNWISHTGERCPVPEERIGIYVPLTKGKFAIIDRDDYERVSAFKWQYQEGQYGGYAARVIWGFYGPNTKKTQFLHHFILGADFLIDHKDQNRLDCRKHNLRKCTKSQNSINRNIQSNNSMGAKGVSFFKPSGKFRSRIKVSGKYLSLGHHHSVDEAAHAYNKAAIRLHGEFCCLNPVGVDPRA